MSLLMSNAIGHFICCVLFHLFLYDYLIMPGELEWWKEYMNEKLSQ